MTTARKSRRCEQFVNIFSLYTHTHTHEKHTHTLEAILSACAFRLARFGVAYLDQADMKLEPVHSRPAIGMYFCCDFLALSLFALAGPYNQQFPQFPQLFFPILFCSSRCCCCHLLHTYSFHGLTRTFIIFLSRRRAYVTKRQPARPLTTPLTLLGFR